ncbi:MAG: hypothetical protein GY719_31795 [bacterium]|nr:hypothetical protein [bacterium]
MIDLNLKNQIGCAATKASVSQWAVYTALGVLVAAVFTQAAQAAHCHCRSTLKEHRTVNPNDFQELTNVDGLAQDQITIPGWNKNQQIDWIRSAAGAKGSCWSECRKAFGVDNNGNVSSEAAGSKARLHELAITKGQPPNWCGGWLSARLEYAAGTNKYRDATNEYIGFGSRRCGDITCECPMPGSWFDGANCFVAKPPEGTEPFVYEGNLYYTSPHLCPLPGSRFDGANCFVATPPAGTEPFVYDGNLYYTPVDGTQCPLPGSWFDGANCFVATHPAGTRPFVYDGNLYYTPAGGCTLPGSWFDGANCFVARPPAGTNPFVYDGNLYYTPVCR